MLHLGTVSRSENALNFTFELYNFMMTPAATPHLESLRNIFQFFDILGSWILISISFFVVEETNFLELGTEPPENPTGRSPELEL